MTNNAHQIQAGWYDDSADPSQYRWWDGVQWSEHRSPKPQTQPAKLSAPEATVPQAAHIVAVPAVPAVPSQNTAYPSRADDASGSSGGSRSSTRTGSSNLAVFACLSAFTLPWPVTLILVRKARRELEDNPEMTGKGWATVAGIMTTVQIAVTVLIVLIAVFLVAVGN